MSGLSTLLVELDDGTGTFPYNITAYVDMRVGWSLDRGRQDEFGDVEAAAASLTLNNRDGRFTFGSVQYGCFVEQQVRITETFGGGTPSKRITGHVQDWPVEYTDPAARHVPCPIRIIDRQSRLSRRTLDEVFAAEMLEDGPLFLYMLSEPADSLSAGDRSGRGNRSLTIRGTGAAPVFGVPTSPDNTGVTFTGGGKYLRGTFDQKTVYTLGVSFVVNSIPASEQTLALMDSTIDDVSLEIRVQSGTGKAVAYVNIGTSGYGQVSADSVADGLPHRVTIDYDPLSGNMHVAFDDAPAGSSSIPSSLGSKYNRITVGQFNDSTATIFGVAGYDTIAVASAGRADDHYDAQGTLVTDSSDDRIERLAAYAGLASGDLALETGILQSVAQQSTNGASVWSALEDVADAEGGVIFIRGDGKLVLQNRTHRTLKAAGAAAVTLDGGGGDVEHDDFRVVCDTQYLNNLARGSRTDGAQQSYRSDASIAKYEAYPRDLGTLLVTTDDEVTDRLTWTVDAYDEVIPRVNSVTVDLLTLTSTPMIQALLALELGDRITITNLPTTSPVATADLIVEGINEKQAVNEWRLTLNTVGADLFRAWVLGDATYGVLDSTTRLHF